MYTIDYSQYAETVVLPAEAARQMMACHDEAVIRIFLHILLQKPGSIHPASLAEALDLPILKVDKALRFWCEKGLLKKEEPLPAQPEKQAVVATPQKLSRQEVNEIAATSEEIQFLLAECQNAFGRPISPTEVSTLVSLNRLFCLPVPVILMLVRYCVCIGKPGMAYIQKTGVGWLNAGIDTVEKADLHIQKLLRTRELEGEIKQLFGIYDRALTRKEQSLCYTWVEEYGFTSDIIAEAYEIGVNAKGTVNFPYIGGILRAWYLKGYRTLEEVRAGEKVEKRREKERQQSSFSARDLDADIRPLPPVAGAARK
ncbi:DnaD domain protein [Neobittarella massiliensis]|uniref:DnaD domain protein n=1 Tax=Neobittarella massiliensis (ex Bilen et al. 2018) TaxID=2041842 RepID=A0A8J6LY19_9FIRM|nr:DnaD domain protein [Neobittarella massiliensis]MBC3515178.1 DnaD domain protein [Neobittarella massiliensis]